MPGWTLVMLGAGATAAAAAAAAGKVGSGRGVGGGGARCRISLQSSHGHCTIKNNNKNKILFSGRFFLRDWRTQSRKEAGSTEGTGLQPSRCKRPHTQQNRNSNWKWRRGGHKTPRSEQKKKFSEGREQNPYLGAK